MVILAELRAAGTAVLRLPGALRQAGCTAVRDLGGRGEHQPVLLVTGTRAPMRCGSRCARRWAAPAGQLGRTETTGSCRHPVTACAA
jgi:hypothetical protein